MSELHSVGSLPRRDAGPRSGVGDTAEGGTLRVSSHRLLDRIDSLASVGAIDGTRGCSRLALTDEDRRGRDLVVRWMRELGLAVRVDGVGNVIATMPWPDQSPPVLTGSHIDTVATGGRYDGCLGVVAGLEVIETVIAAGTTLARPLAVGFFTGEEGARFAPDMLGSLVYCGDMALDDALAITGIDGAILGDELDRIGYRGPAPTPGPVPHAFVELHIEQGPVLERENRVIGAVTGVQGISWTEVTVEGESNHAGTTPMRMRRDPMVVAARLVAFVHDLAHELPGQVGTSGRIEVHPNLINVVPARAVLTVDLRNADGDILRQAEELVEAHVGHLSNEFGVRISTRPLARFDPVEFDPAIIELVERIATRNGLRSLRMASGAGHDAQMMARVVKSGMIFVPSHRGLSHNPHEHTEAEHVVAGANVLLDVMVALGTEA